MLRWLLIGALIYGIGSGVRDGWLVVKWGQLLNQMGFTSVDPDEPFKWSELIIEQIEQDESKKQKKTSND